MGPNEQEREQMGGQRSMAVRGCLLGSWGDPDEETGGSDDSLGGGRTGRAPWEDGEEVRLHCAHGTVPRDGDARLGCGHGAAACVQGGGCTLFKPSRDGPVEMLCRQMEVLVTREFG